MLNLDVIIPHYKEDEKTIMHALSMIDNQIGIDKSNILITVVTDNGGYKLDEEMLRSVISLPINFIETDKHLGPGYARQYAMDRTSAKYITFCDSDDIFISPFVFKFFEDKLKENSDLECIFTAYLEEKENIIFEQVDCNPACLHGKLYSRQFLKDNNICFSNFMISEDTAFNYKVIAHCKKFVWCDDTLTYVYRCNKNSLTKNVDCIFNDCNIKCFRETFNAYEVLFDEVINNKTSLVSTKIIGAFLRSIEKTLLWLESFENVKPNIKDEIIITRKVFDDCKCKYKKYL